MKTQCKHGHDLDASNVYYEKGRPNVRLCRKCRAINNHKQILRKKKLGVYESFKRERRLMSLGWSVSRWREAWKKQKGKCSICHKTLNLNKKQNSLRACADHEHGPIPIPREILCTNCNAMLGQAKENPSILRAGAEYLEKFLLQ